MKTVALQSKGWNRRVTVVRVTGLALLATLVFVGCGSVPKTRYYTLRVPPPPNTSARKTDFVLQVERFESPAVLRDNRIIFYTSPTQLNFHQYHRWSSDPGELLTEMAMKYFAESGLFQQVYAYPAPVHADYTLRGRVLDLAQLEYTKGDSGKYGVAKVGLKLDLIQTKDNNLVWSARMEETERIEGKKEQEVVNALNGAANRLMQKAYKNISQVVEHQSTQKQNEVH